MQQVKLHKWLMAAFIISVLTSCARSNFPGRNDRRDSDRREESNRRDRNDNVYYPGTEGMPPGQAKKVYGQQSARVFAPGQRKKMARPGGYRPPMVIVIDDGLARSNRSGELYYDNDYGYRYWRHCDGKYYLDSKYEMEGYDEDDGYRNRGDRYKKNKYKKQKQRGNDDDDDDDR